uniref:RalBP1-associated Eps domain-containing protein 2 n=1 Tax=Erpetoichthys calabaricus TaxID=27687 RepID=A0A8C4RHX0_ERPCA
MDPGLGTTSGGLYLSLSENEQRRYTDLLHTLCQPDSSGKVPVSKVGELFRASQLPAETLHQITELCGAKRLGYFGTRQFFFALKLIAAAQSGLPVRIESIKSELPLPQFMGLKNDSSELRISSHSKSAEISGPQSGMLAVKIPRPTLIKNTKHSEGMTEKQEPWSPPLSPIGSPPHSPGYQSSPLCSFGKQRSSTDHIEVSSETKHSSLTATLKEGVSSSNYGISTSHSHSTALKLQSMDRSTEEISSVYPDDLWRINEEQCEYYTVQFKTLQSDLSSHISGSVAKKFFTKSKLSIPELSHIWELSDVDCDGALTWHEFCAAFHLIVARKNGYPLPETLPPTLQPSMLQMDGASQEPKHNNAFFSASFELPPLSHIQKENSEEINAMESSHMPSADADVSSHERQSDSCKSAVSLTMIPEVKGTPTENLPFLGALAKRGNLKHTDRTQEMDPHHKSWTRPRSYSSTSIDDAMKKSEEPPTPPPRPQKTHSRASSLDLNKLFQQNNQGGKSAWLPPPPALPPRPLPSQVTMYNSGSDGASLQKAGHQSNFADFSKYIEESETSQTQPPIKPIRRKHRPESQNLESLETAASLPSSTSVSGSKPHLPVQKQSSKVKKATQTAIRKNKETNAVLARLNSELQQQLKEVHQERIALESQLEQLRPFSFL